MEPAQAEPPKKRRRLMIAFALVLASLVSWWNWPRGDARFVGKWVVTLEHDPTPQTLVLKNDGSGYWKYRSKVHFPWKADGNQLILGIGSRPQVFWEIHDLVASFTSYEHYTRISDKYEVLSLGPNDIRARVESVRFAATNEPFVAIFTRIPE